MISALCQVCALPSTLRCPTCLAQSLADSYFCSQTCFKQVWKSHKSLHRQTKYNPFPSYPYTGSQRPVYPLSPRRAVPSHILHPDYAQTGIPLSEQKLRGSTQIRVLDATEISKMRTICALSREILEEGRKAIKIGVTLDEIDRIVHDATIERNCYPSPLNYHNFPKSVCLSVNEVICHGIPDQYELQDGDILNIDVSAYHDGFHGDLNETYLVGNVDDAGKHLVDTTRKCLDLAIAMCKPGVPYRDLGNVIQAHAHAEKLSVVRTYCGHGINSLFHSAPNVPHYAKNKAVGIMKPGHTFTIEPMICEGDWADEHWPDNWTAVTRDGKRSAQFEQTLLITDSGVEILTKRK